MIFPIFDKTLMVTFGLSFLITLVVTPYWIRRSRKANLVGKDMHKPNKPEVAELGGLPVVLGFLIGLFAYVAINTFVFDGSERNIIILAVVLSVLIAAVV